MSAAQSNKQVFYGLTVLAGLASGLLFLALVSGSAAVPVVGYFVQLPLFFAGFALGLTSAALASAGSLAIVGLTAGLQAALLFAVTLALPVLLVVRYALWTRRGERGEIEWYPAGLLLARLVGLALIVAFVALLWLALSAGSVTALLSGASEELTVALREQGLAPSVVDLVDSLLPYMPGMVAASWLVMIVVNGSLGQWLATKQSMAIRPSSSLAKLELPSWMVPAFAVAAAAAGLVGGDLAIFATTGAMILALPVMLQGLAVVHAMASRLASPGLALGLFYLATFFVWPLIFLVLGLGLIETFAQLRRRFA